MADPTINPINNPLDLTQALPLQLLTRDPNLLSHCYLRIELDTFDQTEVECHPTKVVEQPSSHTSLRSRYHISNETNVRLSSRDYLWRPFVPLAEASLP